MNTLLISILVFILGLIIGVLAVIGINILKKKSDDKKASNIIETAKKQGIRPVLGLELTLDIQENLSVTFYLIARDTQGYKNLMKVSSRQMTNGIQLEDLNDYLQGIAVIIPYFEDLESIIEKNPGPQPTSSTLRSSFVGAFSRIVSSHGSLRSGTSSSIIRSENPSAEISQPCNIFSLRFIQPPLICNFQRNAASMKRLR